jgi:hypothetical protein
MLVVAQLLAQWQLMLSVVSRFQRQEKVRVRVHSLTEQNSARFTQVNDRSTGRPLIATMVWVHVAQTVTKTSLHFFL